MPRTGPHAVQANTWTFDEALNKHFGDSLQNGAVSFTTPFQVCFTGRIFDATGRRRMNMFTLMMAMR